MISVKKMPMGQDHGRVLERRAHARADAAPLRRQAVHDARPVGDDVEKP
jgi:hypothetical protein